MDLDALLREAVARRASDLHLKVGARPHLRIAGRLTPFENHPPLEAEDTRAAAEQILENRRVDLDDLDEIDAGYWVAGLGYFRCNVFAQRGSLGAVLRVIPAEVPPIPDLNLPSVLEDVALLERGLVLVTGTTGSGKSTTLAAMIDHINRHRHRHIVTIEDPIEFLHRDRKSLITQRQLGTDTRDYAAALRSSMRQDPDIILVGEMRDKETIDTALVAAETGHLVFSTLHTLDAPETINRIITVFPPHQHDQIRGQLADVLRAIISMRLVPRQDGERMVPAVEVLIATRFISECIRDREKTPQVRDAIAEGSSEYGMQTFDQSLLSLFEQGLITEEAALAAATNRSDMKLRLRGIVSGSAAER